MLIGRSTSAVRAARHSGEGYLASSADLMIGILFIFIIMVVYLAMEIKRIQTGGKDADPVRTLIEVLGERLQARGVDVRTDPDSGVVTLPADALFEKGSWDPKPEGMAVINKTRDVLNQVVPCFVDSASQRASDCPQLNAKNVKLETVMVEGHTDSDQYANDPDKNWHLGLNRARRVFDAFRAGELGDLKNGKQQPILGVASYADTRPAKARSNGSRETLTNDPKAKDRRVELRFILSYQGDNTGGNAADITKAVEQRQ